MKFSNYPLLENLIRAMPLSLSDDELAAIMDAARPIPPRDRDQFLRDVAVELARYPEVGPGIIGRVCPRLQRQHLAPRRYASQRWQVGSVTKGAMTNVAGNRGL